MRALVLGGAGAIGRWVVRDLTESDGVEEVAVADLDLGRALEAAGWAAVQAGAHGTASVRALALDAADGAALRQAIERVDVVCNCAGHATNLRVMQACADASSHYVDLGGLFHTTREQLTLHDRFIAAGVTAVIGMGASPGTSNVMAALAAGELESVDSLDVRLGIVDLAPGGAHLTVPYAIETLLDQLSQPAFTYADGAFVEVPPMSGQEVLEFPPPLGRIRVGHGLDSTLATLPLSLRASGVRSVSVKLGFGSDFMEQMDLLMGLGLASTRPLDLTGAAVVPRELLVRCIRAAQERPGADRAPDDAAAIRVTATGRDGAGGAGGAGGDGAGGDGAGGDGAGGAGGVPVEVVADCVVRPHAGRGASAGELGASVPASVAAQLLASKLTVEPGVLPPERAIPPTPYLQELARRGIKVSLTTRRLDPINGGRPHVG